ncbi:phosphatidate cytidylyltransferase, partial [Candidatus Pelagibacter sp.]|uniref:phosphatidate cytidylyltransferase n=1 Tax=Candidatus Pelagibacter sp. TaxID=2024849 RepID=UPI003F855870
LIDRIFIKKDSFFLKKIFQFFLFMYLLIFMKIIIDDFIDNQPNISWSLVFAITVCILSDVGGYVFGKFFKGKKLTKISPNKTYSGMLGSFLLSVAFGAAYSYTISFVDLKIIIFISFLISLICQLGDLFISYLKRKSGVKDTGNILPGHGGVLDRIDGIIFAVPFGIFLINIFF